ncbi:MAG: ATP-binding protein [Gemmatimonadaceae bacterium]
MNSLRSRLLLLFLVAFLPIAALTVRQPFAEREAQLTHARSEATLRVEIAQRTQGELIHDSRRYMHAISMLAAVSMGDATNCERSLTGFRRIIDEGWSVSRVTLDGNVDCVSNSLEADTRDSFVVKNAEALAKSDSGLIGPYRLSNATNGEREALATLYVPLVDTGSGTFRGALTIRRRMRWLADLAREVGRDSQSLITLTDSSGLVLARFPNAPSVVGTTLGSNASTVNAPVELRYEGIRSATQNSPARLYVYKELPSMPSQPVYLTVAVSARPIMAAANAALFRSVAWLLVWILLAILCAWYAAERMVLREVRALISATKKLGQGDLDARSGLQVHAGELGQLAGAFDQMAQQLDERQERLAQAQKMESVGQLAGGVAHDFNNLLTAIIGNAEIAKQQLAESHPAREELRQILDAARRSGALTRQLLAFAKRNTMDVHVLSLNALLDDVTSLLKRLIGEHITLTMKCDPALSATRIDPTQFEQLIMNLAVNARDAMPNGGTLGIDVRNTEVRADDRNGLDGVAPGSWVSLTVSDTGTGMSPETVRRAFEPFYTTKGVGKGTGLGLAVVYGTVKQHSGHIRIDSTIGAGSKITILLPPSATPAEMMPRRAHVPVQRERGNETLLLVEDEPAVRSVSARLLRRNGYNVQEATDGADAVAQMGDGKLSGISLLITDVVMQRMGGPELVNEFRKERPSLPVLLVSGYSETAIPQELLQTPGTVFVEKPFSTEALLTAVRKLLDSQVALTS